jgi:hypothetical protein
MFPERFFNRSIHHQSGRPSRSTCARTLPLNPSAVRPSRHRWPRRPDGGRSRRLREGGSGLHPSALKPVGLKWFQRWSTFKIPVPQSDEETPAPSQASAGGLSKVQSVDLRMRMRCGGFRQLRTCRRTRPGQLCAANSRSHTNDRVRVHRTKSRS